MIFPTEFRSKVSMPEGVMFISLPEGVEPNICLEMADEFRLENVPFYLPTNRQFHLTRVFCNKDL